MCTAYLVYLRNIWNHFVWFTVDSFAFLGAVWSCRLISRLHMMSCTAKTDQYLPQSYVMILSKVGKYSGDVKHSFHEKSLLLQYHKTHCACYSLSTQDWCLWTNRKWQVNFDHELTEVIDPDKRSVILSLLVCHLFSIPLRYPHLHHNSA